MSSKFANDDGLICCQYYKKHIQGEIKSFVCYNMNVHHKASSFCPNTKASTRKQAEETKKRSLLNGRVFHTIEVANLF